MATKKPLTVQGVRSRLTRAGVDHYPLQITQFGNYVRVDSDGCDDDIRRRAAFHVLFDAGLSCAPYPGYDLWIRRS
jgi:hypothetical protein